VGCGRGQSRLADFTGSFHRHSELVACSIFQARDGRGGGAGVVKGQDIRVVSRAGFAPQDREGLKRAPAQVRQGLGRQRRLARAEPSATRRRRGVSSPPNRVREL
jgi:hypothetical protein